jgi:hypothetical protein
VEKAPCNHWVWGWVGSRACLDAVERRKISGPYRESSLGRPACSQSLYWLSYPALMNGRSRKLLLGLASRVILVSESCGIHYHILLAQDPESRTTQSRLYATCTYIKPPPPPITTRAIITIIDQVKCRRHLATIFSAKLVLFKMFWYAKCRVTTNICFVETGQWHMLHTVLRHSEGIGGHAEGRSRNISVNKLTEEEIFSTPNLCK